MKLKALAALALLLAGPLVAALLAAEDETVVLFSRRIADSLQKLRDSEQRLQQTLAAPGLSDRRRKTLEASLAECVGHRRELATALESVATVRKQQLRPRT